MLHHSIHPMGMQRRRYRQVPLTHRLEDIDMDSIMDHIQSNNSRRGLRIVRVIPLDMDVPHSRRDVDTCSAMRPSNVRWLLRNLGVRNSEHKDFDKTIKKLKIMASKIAREG
jgi:predicted nuclease with TOPRIM domain